MAPDTPQSAEVIFKQERKRSLTRRVLFLVLFGLIAFVLLATFLIFKEAWDNSPYSSGSDVPSQVTVRPIGQATPRLTGADLGENLAQYVGKQVILTDCKSFMATCEPGEDCSLWHGKRSIVLTCGRRLFWVETAANIDRESLRALHNCVATRNQQCQAPLVVTPTGQMAGPKIHMPVVKDVRIAR